MGVIFVHEDVTTGNTLILVLKPTSCDYRRLFAVPNIRHVHFNLVHNALVRAPLLVIGSAFAHLLFFQKSCTHILAKNNTFSLLLLCLRNNSKYLGLS